MSVCVTPNTAIILGMATLTMLVSKIAMNTAMMMASMDNIGIFPLLGCGTEYLACAAEADTLGGSSCGGVDGKSSVFTDSSAAGTGLSIEFVSVFDGLVPSRFLLISVIPQRLP